MLLDEHIEELTEEYSAEWFVYQMNNPEKSLQGFFETILDHLDESVVALAVNLEISYSDAESKISSSEYLVLTDEEADKEAKARANNKLVDELYNIPEHLITYFDKDSYIDEQLEDRDSLLDYWDGSGDEETVNGTTYYIYRQ